MRKAALWFALMWAMIPPNSAWAIGCLPGYVSIGCPPANAPTQLVPKLQQPETSSPRAAPATPPSDAYEDGADAWRSLVAWLAALPPDRRAGADYWAANRSRPGHGTCGAAADLLPATIDRADYLSGCEEASRRLAPIDTRRLSEPEYRAGFNEAAQEEPIPPPGQSPPPTPPAPSVTPPPPAPVYSEPRSAPAEEPAPHAEQTTPANPIWVLVALIIGLYFLPFLTATLRQHRNTGSIFVINLFLGWTLIGWVGSLAWAMSSNTDRVAPVPNIRPAAGISLGQPPPVGPQPQPRVSPEPPPPGSRHAGTRSSTTSLLDDAQELLPLRMNAEIIYVDRFGNRSQRQITVHEMANVPGYGWILKSFCHLRQAERSFLSSRIERLIDLSTGLDVDDASDYFTNLFRESPRGALEAATRAYGPEIDTLVYIARRGGRLMRRKREAIASYVQLRYGDPRLEFEMLAERVRLWAVDEGAFRRSLHELAATLDKREREALLLLLPSMVTSENDPFAIAALRLAERLLRPAPGRASCD